MYKSRAVHTYAYRILCMILALALAVFISPVANAEAGMAPKAFDRYDHLETTIAPGASEATSTEGDLDSANKSKEELDIEEFNGSFLDTVIYIIGGLCGIMMLLQITAFAVCKLYPSWNHIIAKLSKIGISGYEDGWIAPTIKILLLGILGYLCVSGTMKHLVAYILGWYTNFIKFD